MKKETEYTFLCFAISQLSAGQQKTFFDDIGTVCTSEQIDALKIGTAYMHLISDSAYREIVKREMAEQLYKDFTEQK